MKKQDRQGSRTPADVERRFRGVPAVASDAQRRATKAEQEVKNLKNVKITVDRLDIDGQELNVRVAATNITGKLTADQIDAKGLTVEAANITGTLKADQIEGIEVRVNAADIQGTLTADQIDADGMVAEDVDITGIVKANSGMIGGWNLGTVRIPTSASEYIEENALASPTLTDTVNGRMYTYQVFLTPRGVYINGRYDTSGESGATYYNRKTWLELLI